MQVVTIPQINKRLQQLPPEKLIVVYDFISYLAKQELKQRPSLKNSASFQTMLTSEAVLERDGERPAKKRRIRGRAKGLIIMHADFDEPLEDFKDYMQ